MGSTLSGGTLSDVRPILTADEYRRVDKAYTGDLNAAMDRAGYAVALAAARAGAIYGKKVVVLSSHSPASIVNSCERDGERVSLLARGDFVKYATSACQKLDADYFMPIASQAVFHRSDSRWANAWHARSLTWRQPNLNRIPSCCQIRTP